jgi:alpha-beta hydrolase superfamily lysophospholipase
MFTTTPRWIDYINSDPMTLRRASLRFFLESRRLDIFIKKNRARLDRPCLLAVGTGDRIINVEGTMEYFRAFGNPQNRIKIYNNTGHTLEFETNPTWYFEDMAGWFLKMT